MSTELEQVLRRLDSLEAKLDAIASQLVKREAAPRTQHLIDRVERYTSRSGNTTWKAFSETDNVIYLRQAHKDMLKAAGLWDSLNAMHDGERAESDIALYTVPDGDFLKPVEIGADGWVKVPERENPGLERLKALAASENYLALDVETTDLDGYVCQIAVLTSAGETLLNVLVKPPVEITVEATAVHGITNDMVADSPDMPLLAAELGKLLKGQSVIGWNVDFDRAALLRTLNHYPEFSALLEDVQWVDAMPAFAPIYGDWDSYHKNYKLKKLTTAAAHYGISTNGAHNAVDDCRMTLEVVKQMVAES